MERHRLGAGGLNWDAQQLVAVPNGGQAVAGRFTATADSAQSLGHVGNTTSANAEAASPRVSDSVWNDDSRS
jgi:hypothetical protein